MLQSASIAATDVAFLSAVALRGAGSPSWLFVAIALAALASSGSYKTRAGRTVTADASGFLARLAVAAAVTGTLLWSNPATPHMLRLLPVSAAALLLGRVISYTAVRRLAARNLRPVLIAGAGESGVEFAEVLKEHPEYGLRPVGFLDEGEHNDLPLPLLGTVADLERVAHVFDCRNVIVAFGSTREADMVRVLRACEENRFNIWVIPRFFELGVAAPGPHTLDIWGLPLFEIPHNYTQLLHRASKRALDIVVSALGLIFLTPVLAAIAVAVKASSPGPVLFRQERVGRGGRKCDVLKFRSMRVHDGSETNWTDADNITAIGHVLRTSSLDELPQLWNVLRGEMSLVGPRPERPHFAQGFAQEIPDYDDRHRVAPGMTGWAQVNGLRGDTSITQRVRFDNRYIEQASIFSDLAILVSTVPAICRDILARLRPRLMRRTVRVTGVVVAMGALVGGVAVAARATDSIAVTFKDAPYAASFAPSADKPQSKLWFHDGSWWGLLQASDTRIHVFRLGSDHVWHDTGTRVSDGTGRGDILDAGSSAYVATRTDSRIEVVRLSYNTTSHSYSVASGPNGVVNQNVESVSIARDGRGTLWITTTYGARVWIAYSTSDGRRWSAPFHPSGDTTIDTDDLSAIVGYAGHIGVMWSDQQSGADRFAVHADGASTNSWTVETVTSGVGSVDDHLNLRTDGTRVYAVIKTSQNDIPGTLPPTPVISVFAREANGTWNGHTAWEVGTGATRGIGLLDTTNNRFLVYATSPESSGTIYAKSASLSDFNFPTGKGTPFIQATGALMNNATSTKQSVNATTGVVVLATDQPNKTYYHSEQSIVAPDVTPPAAPVVQATAVSSSSVRTSWAPSSADTASYRVYRDGNLVTTTPDTSFVDGGLLPSTTYTYTAEALDTSGNTSPRSAPAPVTTPALGGTGIDFRASSTAFGVDTRSIDLPVPSGVTQGDALLSTIDVRGNPTITAPADWSLVRSDQNGFAMKKTTYIHVATSAEPATYTWGFSQTQSSTGVMLDYVGVDATNPVDTSAGSLNAASSKILATGITTSAGNERIVGLFSTTVAGSTAPPAGMSETGETTSSAGLYDVGSETADTLQAAAGPTGDKSATCSFTGTNIGQLIALRPNA